MSDMAIKHYTLKSKDVSLLNFNLIKKTSIIDNLPYVTYKIEVPDFSHTNNALWPKGLYKGSDKEKLTEELFVWLKSRKAPKNRVFIDKVID